MKPGSCNVDLITNVANGNQPLDQLIDPLYADLKRIASSQIRQGLDTLQPTELVSEAYLRLIKQRSLNSAERTHFFSAATSAMRRILFDRARNRSAQKREGIGVRIPLSSSELSTDEVSADVYDLEEALSEFEEQDPERSRILKLRILGGLEYEEIRDVLSLEGISLSVDVVGRRVRAGLAWLEVRLGDADA